MPQLEATSRDKIVTRIRITQLILDSSLGWPRCTYAHEPGATAVTDWLGIAFSILELELIKTQMAQKPMLRAEVGMRVRCANKASAE